MSKPQQQSKPTARTEAGRRAFAEGIAAAKKAGVLQDAPPVRTANPPRSKGCWKWAS